MLFRTLVLTLHLWAGLLASAFLLVLGLTGSLLVYERGIDHALNRRLAGGKARPEVVYEGVKKFFSQLTEADLLETQPSGDNKFKNVIRFARQALIDRGELYSPGYGIWE